MRAIVRLVFAFGFLVCLASRTSLAQVPDAYAGMSTRIGDVHQHALSPQDARALAQAVPLSPGYCTNGVGARHEFGFPPLVFDAARTAGYEWTNLAPHTTLNMSEEPNDPRYTWWINPTSSPVIVPADPPAIPDVYYIPGSNPATHYTFRRSAAGYPFYKANDPNFQNLGGLATPWSYWLSNGTAADSRTVNGSYVAFAGTELTSFSFTPSTTQSGHRLAIIPGAVRGCSVVGGSSAAANCSDDFEFGRWVVQNGGLVVQAHPGAAPSLPTLHPTNRPTGFSESVVMGLEIGGGFQGFIGAFFETSLRSAMNAGYRMFPAFGADLHQTNHPYCNAFPVSTPGPQLGGTVCWSSSFDRTGITGAMKARRCYFSNGYEPTLKLEACSNATCSAGVAKMGDTLALASGTTVHVRVSASNDLRNQEPAVQKRLDRVELVHQNGSVIFSQSCTRGTNGGGANPAIPDSCNVPFTAVSLPATASAGGFYARVCTLVGGRTTCADNGVVPDATHVGSTPTQLVSAPIFVNWDQYRAATGKRFCDFTATSIPCGTAGCLPSALDQEQDGYPNTCDTCPTAFDPTQPDTDKSGIGDACNTTLDLDGDEYENLFDNCLSVANPTQANLDGDSLGDACDTDDDNDGVLDVADNCPTAANSNQLNSDSDSRGDVCDNCKLVANQDQADGDMDYNFSTGLFAHADGVGDACDNCTNVYNPVPAAPPPANRTTTGGQVDDDADGYGNACDLDYDNDGVVATLPDPFYGTCGEDVDFWNWANETGKPATANTCGASGTLRCELFDMDGDGVLSQDVFPYMVLVGANFGGPAPLGPKCPTCPLACAGDNCVPPDTDGDGRRDGFDNCPTVANATQADDDADGVGQVCDNCTTYTNRRVPLGCVVQLGWLTTTGGQRDDDHDGYGNRCDAKFAGGVAVGGADLTQFRASETHDRTLDDCGTTHLRPCAIFDLDEVNDTIDAADLDVFRALNGKMPGPKCTLCPLTCATGINGTCN